MIPITIVKCDYNGDEILRYQGGIVERTENAICIQATFAGETRDLGYVLLKKGDRFTEWFFTEDWFNIFRIQDVDTGLLKGWYCNFTRPARIGNDTISADDLALDYFVDPQGKILVLDEDEFHALPLSQQEKDAVRSAEKQLRQLITQRLMTFVEIIPDES